MHHHRLSCWLIVFSLFQLTFAPLTKGDGPSTALTTKPAAQPAGTSKMTAGRQSTEVTAQSAGGERNYEGLKSANQGQPRLQTEGPQTVSPTASEFIHRAAPLVEPACVDAATTNNLAAQPAIKFTVLQDQEKATNMNPDLRDALTFHANFDTSTDAVVAKGDGRLYSAPSYREQDAAVLGLQGTDVIFDKQAGRVGGALRFTKKNTKAVFYKAAGNVPLQAKAWTGTISFWLSLDPQTDLDQDYCDPIQVTDKSYNDSAIWVDFTKDDRPKVFRLGVFGNLKDWNPENRAPEQNPDFLNRLVVVKQPPFAKDRWTHVTIVHEGLGTDGSASLYLNGKLQGRTPAIREPFSWNVERSTIRLGLSYAGLFDDLMIFNRALQAEEVARLATGQW